MCLILEVIEKNKRKRGCRGIRGDKERKRMRESTGSEREITRGGCDVCIN
jgi:hypothetical protein